MQNLLARNLVSDEFQNLVKIQIVVAKYSGLLSHNTLDQPGCASIMRLIESELDVLSAAAHQSGGLTQSIMLSILDVKLHFYACLLTKLSQQAPSQQATFKNVLSTALRIVHLSSKHESSSSTKEEEANALQWRQSRCKDYYRRLVFATVILIKLFHLNSATPKEEQQAALTHIGHAQNIYIGLSYEESDEFSRTAKFLECLARQRQDHLKPMTALRLNHMMGVSVLFDALSTAAELRGKPVEVPQCEDSDYAEAYSNAGTLELHGQMSSDQALLDNLYHVEYSDVSMAFFSEFLGW